MTALANIRLYFNCFFFDKDNKKTVFTYKMESTQNTQYPFQLFRKAGVTDGLVKWENLSIYPSIYDSVCTFLKELYSEELADEVYHGQASLDPAKILEKIDQGKTTISIYAETNNEAIEAQFDVSFESLIQRDGLQLKRQGRR